MSEFSNNRGPPGVETQTALCAPRAQCARRACGHCAGPLLLLHQPAGGAQPPGVFLPGTEPSPLRPLIPDQVPLYRG